VDARKGKRLMDALSGATGKGLVKSCHDLSEGGLGVAAAEMAFAGGLGMALNLKDVPLGEKITRDDFILFAESNTRFLAEVAPADKDKFEKAMSGVAHAAVGRVTAGDRLTVTGLNGEVVLDAGIYELKEAWQAPLRW